MRDLPRLSAALTVRALQAGAVFVIGLLAAGLVLQVLGSDVADRAATLGVFALVATPALALAATSLETWRTERTTAVLALLVLGVLAVATVVALFIAP